MSHVEGRRSAADEIHGKSIDRLRVENPAVNLLGPLKNVLENRDVDAHLKLEFKISADGRQINDFRLETVFHCFLEL